MFILSERNLLALLTKLRWQGSARTIVSPDGTWSVKAEPDELHYAGRGPGRMHPRTEHAIVEYIDDWISREDI